MSGLDAPRGLAWGPEGGLYVTEAGDGTATGPCTPVAVGSNCYSETGKITRLFHGQQERVVTGLPSIFNTMRRDIVGPNDISFQGRGTAFVTIGWGGNPTLRANLGDLLRVAANGNVSLVATFSPASNGAEPVPTEVELGPDGALYVSQLTGAPFTKGVAGIFKIVNGQPQLVQGGFKTVIDFTFGPDGSMYVLEHASSDTFFGGPGRLTRVAPNGTRTLITEALNRPTSVLVGDDGAIYVSNNGVSVGTGEVLKIQP